MSNRTRCRSGFKTLSMFKCFLPPLLMLLVLAGCGGGSQALVITGDAMLPPCPKTPNCVSSLSTEPAKHVEPFPVLESLFVSMTRIAAVIRSLPRANIVSSSESRVHVEFRSILGFVDDLVFVASPEENVIHVRSAARSGSWDLGVNRRRVERIRKLYMTAK